MGEGVPNIVKNKLIRSTKRHPKWSMVLISAVMVKSRSGGLWNLGTSGLEVVLMGSVRTLQIQPKKIGKATSSESHVFLYKDIQRLGYYWIFGFDRIFENHCSCVYRSCICTCTCHGSASLYSSLGVAHHLAPYPLLQ